MDDIKVEIHFQFLDGELISATAQNGYKGIDYGDVLDDVTLKDLLEDFK